MTVLCILDLLVHIFNGLDLGFLNACKKHSELILEASNLHLDRVRVTSLDLPYVSLVGKLGQVILCVTKPLHHYQDGDNIFHVDNKPYNDWD